MADVRVPPEWRAPQSSRMAGGENAAKQGPSNAVRYPDDRLTRGHDAATTATTLDDIEQLNIQNGGGRLGAAHGPGEA